MRYILLLLLLIVGILYLALRLARYDTTIKEVVNPIIDENKTVVEHTTIKSSESNHSATNPKIIDKIESNTTRLPTIVSIIVPTIEDPTMEEQLSLLGANIGDPIFIRIFKLTAELEIWIKVNKQYKLLKNYTICRQSGRLGPKLKEGDLQGPEGFYYVTKERLNPNSKFHLSFNLGYPNKYDREHGRTGSALMIHGDCVSVGCFAMTDKKIEEIYELVEQALEGGQQIVRVHIFPFRMSSEMMTRFADSRWYQFWLNLKEGYDYFEQHSTPPNVSIEKKRYIFNQ